MAGDELPFWRVKSLREMTDGEWEALCDGCGRCCLNKLEDWDTGDVYWTNLACPLLDTQSCRCSNYPERQDHVPDCIALTPVEVETLGWLPPTCAYRLIDEGRELYEWHPLRSGDPDSVHRAGVSVRGRVTRDEGVPVEEYENHLADWPGHLPPGMRRARRLRR